MERKRKEELEKGRGIIENGTRMIGMTKQMKSVYQEG